MGQGEGIVIKTIIPGDVVVLEGGAILQDRV